jgi:hypothetical protein
VNHSTGVDVFQTPQQLVHEILFVLTGNLRVKADNVMKIGIHVIGNHVKLAERGEIAWQN